MAGRSRVDARPPGRARYRRLPGAAPPRAQPLRRGDGHPLTLWRVASGPNPANLTAGTAGSSGVRTARSGVGGLRRKMYPHGMSTTQHGFAGSGASAARVAQAMRALTFAREQTHERKPTERETRGRGTRRGNTYGRAAGSAVTTAVSGPGSTPRPGHRTRRRDSPLVRRFVGAVPRGGVPCPRPRRAAVRCAHRRPVGRPPRVAP